MMVSRSAPARGALVLLLAAMSLAPLVAGAAAGLEEARKAWRAGELSAAVITLKGLLQQDPDDAEARGLLARIYSDLGDPAAAEQEIRRARAAGLADLETLPVLGEALLAQGRYADLLDQIESPADAPAGLRAELLALRGDARLAQEDLDAANEGFAEALDADPNNIRAALGQARLLAVQGDIEGARAAMVQLAEQNPSSALAWEALGSLAFAAQDHKAAAEAFGKAIEHGRGAWSYHFRRGLARIETGDADGALADAEAVAAAVQGYPGLAYLRGRVRLTQGDSAAAVDDLESYLRAAPDDPRGIYYAALALIQQGRHAQAEDYLMRLRNRFPNSAMTATLLGLTRLQRGDASGAEAVVAPFAKAPDATPTTLDVLRRALAAQGRRDEAAAQVERMVERFPELIAARLLLVQQQQAAGEHAASIEQARIVLAEQPESLQAHILLVRGLLLSGDDAAALAAADALLEVMPEAPMAHAVKAAVLTRQQNFDGARAAFRRALELDPAFTRAALGLAALEAGTEGTEAARKTIDDLLAADPDNTGALLASAGLARREGGSDAYIAELAQGLERNPDDIAVRLLLARAYLETRQADAALRLLQEAPAAQADVPALLLLRANAELTADRGKSALATLGRLAELSPQSAQPRFLLAAANARIGDLRSAETYLLEGLQIDDGDGLQPAQLATVLQALPSDRERRGLLDRLLRAAPGQPAIAAAHARFAAQEGDFGIAIKTFESLRRNHPDVEDHAIGLAQMLDAAGRSGEAAAELETWLEEHPRSVAARLLLAQIALGRQRMDEAVAEYRRIIEIAPSQPVALNNLAMLLADDAPEEALGFAERGLALRPEEPAYLDTVGLLLLKLDQPERARDLLARAHQATPDPSIAFRYAKALATTGAADQARRVLLQNVDKSYPEQAEAQALLKSLGD